MKPWISKGLQVSIKYKNHLYYLIRNKKKKRDDLKSKYNLYKKRLENLKELAKRKYFSNKIEKCKGKSQVLWETIHEIVSIKPRTKE